MFGLLFAGTLAAAVGGLAWVAAAGFARRIRARWPAMPRPLAALAGASIPPGLILVLCFIVPLSMTARVTPDRPGAADGALAFAIIGSFALAVALLVGLVAAALAVRRR